MNILKKFVGSLALGAILTTTVGVASFAQDWNRNNQSQQRRSDREYGRDNRENNRYNRRSHRRDDWGNNDRYNRGNGDGYNNGQYNRRNGGGYNDQYENNSYARKQIEKGYRDGLDRGRKDAQTNRQRTPNNSSHYQKGNQYYRQGFERGFFEAYNQYSNDGRNRRW